MISTTITKGACIEDSAVVLLARVALASGAYIAQANVSSLTIKVFDGNTGTLVASPTAQVSDVVFDSLQTADTIRWEKDKVGYNFALTLDGTNFPTGDSTYRVEVKLTPVLGDALYLLWELDCTNIFSG